MVFPFLPVANKHHHQHHQQDPIHPHLGMRIRISPAFFRTVPNAVARPDRTVVCTTGLQNASASLYFISVLQERCEVGWHLSVSATSRSGDGSA